MAFNYTKRKDGRLMKRVSIDGKLKTIYSNDPKDLEKQYIELKHLSNKGMLIEDSEITLQLWSERWFQSYKTNLEKATQKMYLDALKLYIIPHLGGIKLKYLKESDIVSLLNKLNDKPRQKEIVLLTLRQILNKAVDNDLIYKNVANKIQLKKHKSAEKTPLTETDIYYLKKVAENNPRSFMLVVMLYTGMRREEIAGLRYEHIDIENKTILIKEAIHWENNQPQIKRTKNGEERKVPILDIIYDKLSEMKKGHKNKEVVFPSIRTSTIMSETAMKRLLESTLYKMNKLYEKDYQEKNSNEDFKEISFTYHQLRHTYTCFLHKADIPVKEAQYLTGHKTLNVLLNIYTHLDNEDKQNATNKLNNLFKV